MVAIEVVGFLMAKNSPLLSFFVCLIFLVLLVVGTVGEYAGMIIAAWQIMQRLQQGLVRKDEGNKRISK